MMSSPRVLLCECVQAQRFPAATATAMATAVRQLRLPFLRTPDLCALAQSRNSQLLAALPELTVVLACRPRAVRWLLALADEARATDRPPSILDLAETTPETALRQVAELCPGDQAPATITDQTISADNAAVTWFPVIDRERCSACGQCLDFCLFGVYQKDDDGRIVVANPGACKDGCPACARICPRAAIIFPRHADAAVNGGERPPPTVADDQLLAALRARRAQMRLLRNPPEPPS